MSRGAGFQLQESSPADSWLGAGCELLLGSRLACAHRREPSGFKHLAAVPGPVRPLVTPTKAPQPGYRGYTNAPFASPARTRTCSSHHPCPPAESIRQKGIDSDKKRWIDTDERPHPNHGRLPPPRCAWRCACGAQSASAAALQVSCCACLRWAHTSNGCAHLQRHVHAVQLALRVAGVACSKHRCLGGKAGQAEHCQPCCRCC